MTPRRSGFSWRSGGSSCPLAGHARGGVIRGGKEQWTYLEFLDQILRREVDAKQGKRIRMGLQIAHFPCVRTIEGFDFSFQPSADERLIRELSTEILSHMVKTC